MTRCSKRCGSCKNKIPTTMMTMMVIHSFIRSFIHRFIHSWILSISNHNVPQKSWIAFGIAKNKQTERMMLCDQSFIAACSTLINVL